jgi:hypothetical protein
MTARSVFLRDQHEAASADAANSLRTFAARLGAPAPDRQAGPRTSQIVQQIQDRCTGGLQPTCEHLGSVPAVAVFIVRRPARLLCGPCATDVANALRSGTTEAGCDLCGRRLQLRAVAWALGPLLLAYDACEACYRSEAGG